MFRGDLTTRVQRILSREAQEEARAFNSDQILPEHVVMAILREEGCAACKALAFLCVDIKEFKRALEDSVPRIPGKRSSDDVPPAVRTKNMLDLPPARPARCAAPSLARSTFLSPP
ncbi:MAG: Clp protease N-terminal domain-containing protein [Treponema sp.]|nr:Clp protease N-terminal domain-containing protein [Treponema sp.]